MRRQKRRCCSGEVTALHGFLQMWTISEATRKFSKNCSTVTFRSRWLDPLRKVRTCFLFQQQWSQWSIVLTGNQTATIYAKTYIIINNLIDDNRCPLVVRAATVSPEVQFNGQPFDLPRSAQYAV